MEHQLRLALFPGRAKGHGLDLEMHDQCFRFWRDFWEPIYREAGAAESFRPDEFFRQDIVGCVFKGGSPVAMWGNTFFELRSAACESHSYFSMHSAEFLESLRRRKLTSLVTLEYFTVERGSRGRALGASFGRVIAALSGLILVNSEAGALVAVARADVGANKIAYEMGYERAEAGRRVRNFTVDTVLCPRQSVRPFPDESVNQMALALWEERTDFTFGLVAPRNPTIVRAA